MLDNNPDQNRRPDREFNLMDELSRGIIYRGGKELEDYMEGYAFGILFWILVLAFLFILGSLGFDFCQ